MYDTSFCIKSDISELELEGGRKKANCGNNVAIVSGRAQIKSYWVIFQTH